MSSVTYLWDLSTALAIHSLAGSLSHSLSTRSIPVGACCTGLWAFLYTFRPSGAFKGRCAGISIALAIHSLDCTLQRVLFKQALKLFNLAETD